MGSEVAAGERGALPGWPRRATFPAEARTSNQIMKKTRAFTTGKRVAVFLSFLSAAILTTAVSGATLTVEFKAEEGEPADYEEVNIFVLNMETARSLEDAVKFSSREKSFAKEFEDLSAGRYVVLTFTGPFEQVDDASRPGAFRAQDHVVLEGDDASEKLTVQYEVLDTDSWIGTESARGTALDGQKKPLAGIEVAAKAAIEKAGQLTVSKAETGVDGTFTLKNLASGQQYNLTDSGGTVIGQIAAGDDVTVQLPPQVGQTAPDFSFVHLASDETRKLSDLRGKVVVLEFWASWCGPCQEPMSKMQTYREKHPEWGDKVELLTLSIDDEKQTAVEHLKKNGWNRTDNAWAGDGGFEAEAPQSYAVSGIPTAYLIDQDGKISAMGHPMSLDMPALVDDLLAD